MKQQQAPMTDDAGDDLSMRRIDDSKQFVHSRNGLLSGDGGISVGREVPAARKSRARRDSKDQRLSELQWDFYSRNVAALGRQTRGSDQPGQRRPLARRVAFENRSRNLRLDYACQPDSGCSLQRF